MKTLTWHKTLNYSKSESRYPRITKKNFRTKIPLLSILNGSIIDLATPLNLNIWYNMGSCLGLVLGLQLLSGLFVAMHYCADTAFAFDSISHLYRDVFAGWFLRSMHANGASFFIIVLYIHVGRAIYYGSFKI